MSFRDSLKPASTKALKQKMEEDESKIPVSGGNSEFLKLQEGMNKVRIFPPYPGDDTFLVMRSACWLGVENDEGKVGRKTFQNAKVHAGTKHDIIEEYINAAKTKLSASKDPSETKKLTNMTQYSEGNTASLGYSISWLLYGKIVGKTEEKLGLLEIKKMVRDAIKSESIIEDEDEAIELDPFTDPELGKPALITYHKKPAKNEKHYKLILSKNALPLTEEDVDWFEKQKPLSKLPLLKIKLEDYDKILDGLRNYDDEFEIGVFETDGFEKMIETCREELEAALAGNSSDDDDEEDTKATKKSSKKEVKKDVVAKKKVVEEEDEEELDEEAEEDDDSQEEVEGDKFDGMDREELKVYNKEKGYGIPVIKGKTTDDDLREAIREKEAEAAKPKKKVEQKEVAKKKTVVAEVDDEDDDLVEADDVEETVVLKKKPNLADLKEKLKNNKK